VLVNAVSIKEGGPRVVLLRLLQSMQGCRPDVDWCVAVPPEMAANLGHHPRTQLLAVNADRSPLSLFRWYEHDLSATARRWRSDVVFSVTNYLPVQPMRRPTLLLEQHAGHFSGEFDRLTRQAIHSEWRRRLWQLKGRWVRRSVNAATVLTVQTQALADAITKATGRPRESIRVIPHGPGWVQHSAAPVRRHGDRWRIGYTAKWGVQKNFVTLLKAVERLRRKGFPVTLVLTLDAAHGPVPEFLAQAQALVSAGVIENRGEVPGESMAGLYDELDIFVFPSLCESFGMPMVEAMARGLPIVVADVPVNREITGDAGLTFPALDADALASILATLIDDAEKREMYAVRSLARARAFSWNAAALSTLEALDAAAGANVA
jgi:glycosyltransferase involved in cell wall biosynthesis